jgi:hypothetical protein
MGVRLRYSELSGEEDELTAQNIHAYNGHIINTFVRNISPTKRIL